MPRFHRIKVRIVGGRNEIYAAENEFLTSEQVISVPLEPTPEHLLELVRRVNIHKQVGWSAEEIQRGHRDEQARTT